VFSGVRLIDQNTFSLTIYKDICHISMSSPMQRDAVPISVIAPGFTVADDGDGPTSRGRGGR
jgi:hypothetical protein